MFRQEELVFGSEPPSTFPDPLGSEAGGRPPLYVDGDIPRDIPLLAQVRVTSPPPAVPEQQSPLRMDWELVPSAGGDAIAPPVKYLRLAMLDGGQLLDVMVDLDLAAVAPGDYTLRLTAEDLVHNMTDTRSYPITLAP